MKNFEDEKEIKNNRETIGERGRKTGEGEKGGGAERRMRQWKWENVCTLRKRLRVIVDQQQQQNHKEATN